MKDMKRPLALVLVLSVALTLIPAQSIAQNEKGAGNKVGDTPLSEIFQTSQSPVAYQLSPTLDTESAAETLVQNPSGITYDTRVSYEIEAVGLPGQTDADTRSAVIHFTLDNPGEQPVSFRYKAVYGSAEYGHLTGAISGTVILSQAESEKDVIIEIAPFADNPGNYNMPNTPNTFWTGEHIFYLCCGDIQNALFDGDRESITVPMPVKSEFDCIAAYDNAANTELIDLNQVAGGTSGVYPVPEPIPENHELRFTAEISGDVRKMLDAGVFSHIHLPQGYFVNESDGVQEVTYHIRAKNDEFIPPKEAYIFQSKCISLAANGQTSFYSGEFTRELPAEEVNLGAGAEGNGIFNKLDFSFDYSMVTSPDAISTCFLDETGQYLQYQVGFSDQVPPVVKGVSTGMDNAHYGDDIPITIEFSEPVYTGGITFKVDDQTLSPMEGAGTISQRVSFLYRLGDEALNAESFTINVSDISGAVDLSGKTQEGSGSGSALVNISFDPRLTFAYCAQPSVSLDQGTGRNMAATVSIPLKQDTELSNWLTHESRLSAGNLSTVVKARAITTEGTIDIPLTVQTDLTRVTGLTGFFTVPENTTDDDVLYALEIYVDTGSGYKRVDSLVTIYAVQPIILVDDENDITLDYITWPPGDSIFINAGSTLSLGYYLNVDATWIGLEYFKWSSSDESIAEIDENGSIILNAAGQVYFTLAVTNPLSEEAILFNSRTLSVLESQDAYLYVPNGVKNQDLLIGSDAKISFSSNLADRNDLYGGSGTETTYTFTLYDADYDDGGMKKGSPLSTEVIRATAQAPLNSYTVPAALLTKVTAKNQYGYILEISAKDMHSGITKATGANIRIRQLPAKASLNHPESVFLLDNAEGFTVEFNIGNKSAETEYTLTVTKNSESTPIKTVASPAAIEPLTVNISDVESSRLLDVYTVGLKAKNLSAEAWSYDSYCVYVYNKFAMNMLLDGFPAPDALTIGYDFKDGDVIYNTNFLKYRSSIGKELLKTVKINDRAYAWSTIADRVTWQVAGESVSLWYEGRRIGDSYNPALLPGTSLLLSGGGAGSSVITATHTLTGMTDSMNVTLEPLNDKLYLFRVYQNVPCKLVYTNGNGKEKTVTFSGEVGVYEESGIESDVVFYPTDAAENVYDFAAINHSDLTGNQKGSSSFDLYPVNTVKLPPINYNVSLELFDEISGMPYAGDIIIRGGVYLNDKYQKNTTINGKMGNADQTVSADGKGRYRLSFRPADFTGRLLLSDKLRYVIEVGFADNSHLTQYITIENDAILAQKSSPLGVCLKEGIKALDASSIQNSAIVLSQTLTVDGEEKSFYDRIYLEEEPKSAILDMTVMVPQYSNNYYKLFLLDSSDKLETGSPVGEFIYAYPFSDSVTLRLVCDITVMLKYRAARAIKPGGRANYYLCIRSIDGSREIKLSKPLEVQNLINVPDMDNLFKTRGGEQGDLVAFYSSIWQMCRNSGDVNSTEDNDAVKPSLDFLKDYSLDYSSIGLEIQSTDDPLVYRGIIRFAAGSYSKDNPSGLFVGSGEKTSFKFMPGPSDIKAMAKGTFLKKAKEAMNAKGGSFKSYGGGAYIDCEVYYDIDEREWKIRLLYGDFYLGGGGGFKKNFNGWVSFVPVTATFKYTMTAEAGLTILHNKAKNITAYIPRLRPVFSIYGFGGVGFDYTFLAFKAGGYGFVQHEQLYRWYTDNEGLKMDGQQLKILGEVGVEFDIWLAFVKLSGKYVLTDYSKSWEYNQHNEISKKIQENAKEREKKRFLAPGGYSENDESGMIMLVPVEESAAFEDRSYLKDYERFWGSPSSGRRMFALYSAGELTDIWTNAYPNAAPRLSDDGELMVYLSDMDSEDLSDTAVLFALKDGTGSFSAEGIEIAESDYPDSSPSLSGTKEGASAVWVRSFTDIAGEAGSEAAMEDVVNGLAASEIMAGIYKGGAFTSTRLTDNGNPDLSPVTAAFGNRAIAAWRSVTLGDMDNPLDFTCDYIMYSIYDGSDWSEAKCLYDGSIDPVRSLNAALLPDGTSAIVYQISEVNVDLANDSEIICAVLDANGEVVRTLRLTDNMSEDVNPQITTAEFPDGIKRFIIGWNAQTESGESVVQNVVVNADGTLYPEFSLELSDGTGETGYSNFRFTKGADKLEDLSLIWSEPEDADRDGIYEYSIFGTKLLVSDEGDVSASEKQKLLELNEGRILDSLDTGVDSDTEKVHFVTLLSEPSGASTLATAAAGYKNIITAEEPYYEYEDLLPGLDMPVMFTVKNDGIDSITHLTIGLGGQTFEYEDENIASGEAKTYLVSYLVPETLANADFTVTAEFGASGDTCIKAGILKLGLPDVGIYQIDSTRETQRERGFRVLLQNTAFVDLKKGTHTVKLEVWDHPDFTEGSPLKTLTVSDDDFDIINDSLLSLDVTLKEEDLQWLLDENKEIPEGGAWLLFRTVLTEGGNVIEDADISNDIDFVNIYSLIEKNGAAVSLASLSQAIDGKTTVEVEVFNNSMKAVRNGNLIVTLRDESGNALETQQTYNPADENSLLSIAGEELQKASLIFNRTGYTADVTFARVSGESTRLSVLNLTGMPMEFNPDVFEYNLQTYDLNKTILNAVAENPASTISVTKDGIPVSVSGPISMAYGTTVFAITVTTGATRATYTVTVGNNILYDDADPGNDQPVHPNKPKSGESVSYSAGLTICGTKQKDLSVSLRGGRAVVSLGPLAQEIFSGNTEAILDIPSVPGVDGYTLEVPAHILCGPYMGAALTVSTELGSIRIPARMLAGIAHLEGKTAEINMDIVDKSKLPEEIRADVGDRPMLSLTLTLDGVKIDWNNPDAPVTVSIPYTPAAEEFKNPQSIVIRYIDGSGRVGSIPNGRYDPITGAVAFSTTHFSYYAVVYNPAYFNDVAADAWYNKPVSFIAARGITLGTGNGKYSPEAMLTRGEFIVLMMRAYDIKADEDPMDNFIDAGDTYYTGYLAAAKRFGISAGVGNNMFAPDKNITRQEMFTLLYNALRVIKQLPETNNSDEVARSKSLSDFTDNGQIASWAREAMALLVETGIISGNAGKLTPAGITTRAQMAQVLYNLYQG
ncbi:MAG TPA: hypothetical protein DD738_09915 [Ruminiclostridium sp.]|nr:hypothetical protein [Ruminiclostridium sp.]